MYNSKGSKVLNCKLKINAMQMCVVDMYCPKLSNMYVTLNVKVRYILNCELWQVLRVQCCATVSVSSASYFLATVTILPSHCLLSATSRNPAATCSHVVVDNIVPVDNGSIVKLRQGSGKKSQGWPSREKA